MDEILERVDESILDELLWVLGNDPTDGMSDEVAEWVAANPGDAMKIVDFIHQQRREAWHAALCEFV